MTAGEQLAFKVRFTENLNSRLTESQSASDHSDFEGFSDDFDDTEPSLPPSTGPKPLEPPPYGEYISWKEALTAANRWAEPRGYAMTGDRAKYRVQGDPTTIRKKWLIYDRHSKPNFTVDSDKRIRQDRDSVKTDCKIEATVTQVEKDSDVWLFEVIHADHNHASSLSASAHVHIREQYKDKTFKQRVSDDKRVGISAKQTYAALKLANPNNPITMRDVYNERQKVRRSELRGKTPISALLKALIEKQGYEDEFFTLYQSEGGIEGGPLSHLFIAHDKHIDFLMENSEVLITDLIYKINMFQMPLVNVIGMTGTNRNFFAGSMFIPGERYEDYILVFFAIRKLYDVYELRYLLIFVTDACPAEIAAMERVFPGVNHILCIWHINCNILAKLKSLIKTQFNRENGKDVDDEANSQIISQTQTKTEKLAEYLNAKWKKFKRHWITTIEAHSEEMWNTN